MKLPLRIIVIGSIAVAGFAIANSDAILATVARVHTWAEAPPDHVRKSGRLNRTQRERAHEVTDRSSPR